MSKSISFLVLSTFLVSFSAKGAEEIKEAYKKEIAAREEAAFQARVKRYKSWFNKLTPNLKYRVYLFILKYNEATVNFLETHVNDRQTMQLFDEATNINKNLELPSTFCKCGVQMGNEYIYLIQIRRHEWKLEEFVKFALEFTQDLKNMMQLQSKL